MRENVEQIKEELVAQQQSMAVFGAFSQANSAMERLAEKLNFSTLESVLTSLHEKLEAGAEVSAMLSSPAEYDEDELAEEMAEFLAPKATAAPPKISGEKFFPKERVLSTTET